MPARSLGAALLLVLVSLLITGCQALGSSDPTSAKIVLREKPASATATPAPTDQPAFAAKPILTTAPAPTATPAPSASAGSEYGAAPARTIAIGTPGDGWAFDPAAIEATTGEQIALTFTNNAAGPHNLVLISGDAEVAAEINTAGAYEGEASGYIPAHPSIIGHTAGLVAGGESRTITLAGLAAGSYSFICTVPGHFDLGMQGVLSVE
jgi:plastocyanin